MKIKKSILSLAVIGSLSMQTATADTTIPGDLTIGGWVRVDYGSGDRYDEADGEDNFGVQQAAVSLNWKYANTEAVVVVGGTNLTGDASDDDGDFRIRDAFIVWHDLGGSNFSLSAGAQPLLFGLKPNGYPGDRSLQPSVEFGGGNSFAVSNQAGPSLIFTAPVGDFDFRGGLFDTSSSTAEYFQNTGLGDIDGSSMTDNYFLQLGYNLSRDEGLYGVIGAEGRYVGDSIDSTESIFDVGIGYRFPNFDLSLEYVSLDQAITGTVDDESYFIFESTYFASDQTQFFFDYATADEADIDTTRVGMKYSINKHFTFVAEYSKDDINTGDDFDSIDFRIEFKM